MTIDKTIEFCKEKGQACSECGEKHLHLAEWLEELQELRKKDMTIGEEKVYESLYKNLLDSLDLYLIKPILGSDYYSYSMSRHSQDAESCEDLKCEFDKLKRSRKFYRGLSITSILACILALVWAVSLCS